MNTFRLGSLIRRTASQFSARYSLFFAVIPKSLFYSDGTNGESAVYRHARLFRKPLSVGFKTKLSNSVSLMGFVDRPIRVIHSDPNRFSVSTLLRVKDPRNPSWSFRIYLSMWDGIARMCLAHLRQNDLILVSGRLVSYSNSSSKNENSSGLDLYDQSRSMQVKVTEVNYVVAPPSRVSDSQVSPKSETGYYGIEEPKDDTIYLWQVFFANPSEWWDNRIGKRNSKSPDFKHKETGEALWIDSDKPSWVTRQLDLLDKRKARKAEKGCYDEELPRRGRLSDWL